jgi:murein L,D-transpeptidase YafK
MRLTMSRVPIAFLWRKPAERPRWMNRSAIACLLVLMCALSVDVNAGGVAEMSAHPLVADAIEVFKAKRELVLLKEGKPLKTYRVALGGDPVGPKRQQGDHRTPEGHYIIDFHNSSSAFHLSLHISYPNADDRRQAARRGVAPGVAIMIHGLPNGLGWVGEAHRLRDWTDGCIAVTDSEIEEIARAVPDGTPIIIHP